MDDSARAAILARYPNIRFGTPASAIEPARQPSQVTPPVPPEAPISLDEAARMTWTELAPFLSAAWQPGYAAILEVAAVLLSRFRRDPDSFTPAKLAQLRAALGDLGLTPRASRLVDRARQ
jgi:hypothetical protein